MRMYKLLLVCLMALVVAMGCSKSSEQPAETATETTEAPAPMPAMEAVTLNVTGMT